MIPQYSFKKKSFVYIWIGGMPGLPLALVLVTGENLKRDTGLIRWEVFCHPEEMDLACQKSGDFINIGLVILYK